MKHNWMQEYYTVKKIVKKHYTKFNTYNAHFVNIKYNWSIINNNTIVLPSFYKKWDCYETQLDARILYCEKNCKETLY